MQTKLCSGHIAVAISCSQCHKQSWRTARDFFPSAAWPINRIAAAAVFVPLFGRVALAGRVDMIGRMSDLSPDAEKPDAAKLDAEALVRGIQASGRALVLAITGGGSQAIADLLSVPGASHLVLEAIVPYSGPALARFLGGKPDHFCSPAAARAMAMAAYRRASEYGPPSSELLGVACTASLATDRPKRGTHRLHTAWQSATTTAVVSIELMKGRRTRHKEERLAATVILNLIAEACGLSAQLPTDLGSDEPVERAAIVAPDPWQELLAGRIQRCDCSPQVDSAGASRVVFAGAFNPLHAGHRAMAAVAARRLGCPPVYEISITNVDKPPLDFIEIDRRLAQFGAADKLCLTRAPTFVEKAPLFPGATFVVGADTIERIADPKYYGGSTAGPDRAVRSIADQGCRFLVFGRLAAGQFRSLTDLKLPEALAALCQTVSEAEFRADVSSTDLRKQLGERP
jgi:nicotinamide mononucleotide (NMN) deamidase PncC